MLQGSKEWLALRCGLLTGSRMKAAMAVGRNGRPLVARRRLVQTLVQEIKTGCPEYTEPNEYMMHGTRMEPLACMAYEFATGYEVSHVAFVPHPILPYVGFSPDGVIFGEDGIVEFKCPALEPRHTRTVHSQKCPDDYMAQVQGGMWTTCSDWCDFVSYYPSISVEIVRVQRDEEYIKRLAAACADVWDEVQSLLRRSA